MPKYNRATATIYLWRIARTHKTNKSQCCGMRCTTRARWCGSIFSGRANSQPSRSPTTIVHRVVCVRNGVADDWTAVRHWPFKCFLWRMLLIDQRPNVSLIKLMEPAAVYSMLRKRTQTWEDECEYAMSMRRVVVAWGVLVWGSIVFGQEFAEHLKSIHDTAMALRFKCTS